MRVDAGHTDPRTSDTEATERSVGGTQCPNHAIDIDQLERGEGEPLDIDAIKAKVAARLEQTKSKQR